MDGGRGERARERIPEEEEEAEEDEEDVRIGSCRLYKSGYIFICLHRFIDLWWIASPLMQSLPVDPAGGSGGSGGSGGWNC